MRLMPQKISVAVKILVVGFLLTVFGATLLGYLNYTTAKKEIDVSLEDHLFLVNKFREEGLNYFLQTIKDRAVDFSSDGLIRDLAKRIVGGANGETTAALSSHLVRNKISLDPQIYAIFIIDKNGKIIASTAKEGFKKDEDESDDDYFTGAIGMAYGNAFVSDVEYSHHLSEKIPILAASAPLTDKDTGEKLGILVNYYKAEILTNNISNPPHSQLHVDVNQHQSAETYVVDKNGFMITSSNYVPSTVLNQKIDILGLAQCSVGGQGYTPYVNYRGVEVLGGSVCIANGWTIVSEISTEEAFASLNSIKSQIILLIIIFCLAVLGIVYFSVRKIVSPIKKLTEIAEKFGQGDLSLRSNIYSNDEIGELSANFNTMAGKIQDFSHNLEKRVEEQTARLNSEVNKLRETEDAMLNLVDDIEHEKEIAQNIAEDLKKFQLAIENASDHIIITDADAKILYANPSVAKITGYSQAEVIGNNPSLWGKQMPKEFHEKFWDHVKNQKIPYEGEITNRRKSGEKYIAEMHVSPILDQGGEVKFFVGIERDITKAKEIDREKTEFVSLASHQLRTPLTAVNWYAELVLSGHAGKMNKTIKDYVEEIYVSNRRMVSLVDALLNVSRIDLGTFSVQPKMLDIKELIDTEVNELKPKIEQKKFVVKTEIEKDLPKINADPNLIRIVVQNLLTNAVKYTPKDGKITIEASKKGNEIIFSVKDTGCGIPENKKSKIFEKLFRTDNARLIDPDGTGLGLYMVKSIMDKTGGSVWFESKENEGSTFYVSIPIGGMPEIKGSTRLI
jgi:PAS domain S-box-containing protein